MTINRLVLVCFAVAVPLSVHAADTIRVCGVDVIVGISKAAAIELFSSACEVRRLPTSNSSVDVWCLKQTSVPSRADDCFDTAEFNDDRLISITKFVNRSTGDGSAQMASYIFDFVKSAEDHGETVTITSRAQFDDQGWRYRFMNIIAGNRTLILQTIQPIGIPNAVSSIKLEEQLNRK